MRSPESIKSVVALLFFFSLVAMGDTPPPGTVKAKTFTGDGVTAITSTGASGALDVNVTNSGGLNTVNQGNAGSESWFVAVTNSSLPVNACQETGGNLAAILAKLNASIAVTGTVTATNSANGSTGSSVPSAATQVGGVDGSGNLRALKVSSVGVVSVDGSAVTQPVSGTFWQTTQPVSGTVTANAGTGTFTVDASGHTVPVSGTFWQTTQPVSSASLPLPTGAATAAKQPALGTSGAASSDVLTVQGISGMTALKVDGSGVTQPVSAASLPLPTGASSAAKQPALGTAGTASSDVITVQGITSMTALKVDGSGTTQPISGTVTANAGTGTFAVSAVSLPLPTGAATAAKQPALGTAGSSSSDVLSVQGVASMTALKVDGSAVTQPVSGTFFQTTQPVSAASLPLPTGASTSAKQPALGTAGTASSDVLSVQGVASMTALKVDGSGVTQPVSGTVTANQGGSWTTTVTQATGTNLHVVADAGSAIIGKVGIDQTTPGTTNLVALAADQSVNVAQINGVTPLMGNGTTGTGSQRVTIASDNTAFSVNAAARTPSALTVKQAAVTIGTSAVRLTNDGSSPAATRVLLVAELLSSSTANCFFGSSTVTTTSTTRGVQMFPGQLLSFTNDAGDYWGICDAVSQTVFITEQE